MASGSTPLASPATISTQDDQQHPRAAGRARIASEAAVLAVRFRGRRRPDREHVGGWYRRQRTTDVAAKTCDHQKRNLPFSRRHTSVFPRINTIPCDDLQLMLDSIKCAKFPVIFEVLA